MYVLSAKYSEVTNGYTRHFHDAHELLYIVEGRISVNVGEEEREAGAGSLLVFSRFEEHSVRVLTRQYKRYTLLIAPDVVLGSENYVLSSVLINRSGGFERVLDLKNTENEISLLLKNMAREYLDKPPMYDKTLDSMLMCLLIYLYRAHPQLFPETENANTEIVRDIQGRFERDCSEKFTLAALAAEYHVSPSHLSHIFKSVTGYAPIEYLMICRISAAKALLSTTDKSIKEIIDLCGFSDESNFSRTFREKVGVTPSQFRKIT